MDSFVVCSYMKKKRDGASNACKLTIVTFAANAMFQKGRKMFHVNV